MSPVSSGMGHSLRAGKPPRHVTSHPGQLSLTVRAVSNGDGYGHHQEENGEFCVAEAHATRTAGILTQLVKSAGCYIETPMIQANWVIYWLNWIKPSLVQSAKMSLLCNGPCCTCELNLPGMSFANTNCLERNVSGQQRPTPTSSSVIKDLWDTADQNPRQTAVTTSVTRNSAIADKPRDAFRGQSRSPNMVPFHMLGMVSY